MRTVELQRRIKCDGEVAAGEGPSAGSKERLPAVSPRERQRRRTLCAIVALVVGTSALAARSQAFANLDDSPTRDSFVAPARPAQDYLRPTERTKVENYLFDAYGPYPMIGAGVAAGINQSSNAPPKWGQGAEGFGKRFGSDFAIAAVGTTARYGLSAVFKEDALYYRCECHGLFPRMTHAVVSTLTARRGLDGHRVFSFSALVAPYAGAATAVYGWYPGRFGVKDAFRMGNYSLLEYMAGNISLEFLYSGPRSLVSRMHLNNAHGAPVQGPNP